ncbi:hypothetical protein KIPB_001724, partial [Kipferlia bialata]
FDLRRMGPCVSDPSSTPLQALLKRGYIAAPQWMIRLGCPPGNLNGLLASNNGPLLKALEASAAAAQNPSDTPLSAYMAKTMPYMPPQARQPMAQTPLPKFTGGYVPVIFSETGGSQVSSPPSQAMAVNVPNAVSPVQVTPTVTQASVRPKASTYRPHRDRSINCDILFPAICGCILLASIIVSF